MEMFYGMIVLGLATLGAPYLAKMAGYETHRKPFDLVGVSGVFFLLAASFNLSTILMANIAPIGLLLMIISFALGWLGLLIGAFWTAGEVLRESNHGILSGKA